MKKLGKHLALAMSLTLALSVLPFAALAAEDTITTEGGTTAAVYSDIAYAPADALETLDIYVPRAEVPDGGFPVVFYVHGGGYTAGDKAEAGASLTASLAALDHGFALVPGVGHTFSTNVPNIYTGFDVNDAYVWLRQLYSGRQPAPGAYAISIDGKSVFAQPCNIGGDNYFRLRDIAAALSGTWAGFSINFDVSSKLVTVVSGGSYEPLGGDLAAAAPDSGSSQPSPWMLETNGSAVSLPAYIVGGHNYYRLSDIARALGFTVEYNSDTRTAVISSAD